VKALATGLAALATLAVLGVMAAVKIQVSIAPAPSTPSPSPGGPLPRTGTPVLEILAIGAALVVTGGALRLAFRRRAVTGTRGSP
jgi:LPXTG-motif cell wall-anchored protein